MPRCAIIPYEGQEPYIFVSYAHKDAHLVYPILEELDRRRHRIWYDDGIAPGSEWPENIAQHLSGCALTLAFISPNSIASDNCRREITFALSKRKPFLAIILQPTEMSLGMEMQLSAQQCVMKYSYDTDEAFYRKLCLCPELAICLRPEEPAPEPVAAVPPVPAAQGAAPIHAAAPTLVPPAAPIQAAAPAKTAKTPKPKKVKQPLSPQKKRMRIIVAAAIAAVALLACLLPALLKVKITDDKKVGRGESYLSLSNVTVTDATVKQINKLNKLESLTFSNCTFASGVLSGIDLPEEFRSLSIYNGSGIDDLSFLEGAANLTYLTLENCGVTDALLPELNLQRLSSVKLNGNEGLSDLAKLSPCTAITSLDISDTGVTALDDLACEQLYSIDFSNTPISDISPLAKFENLNSVIAAGSKVTDLSPISALEGLTTLNFSGCGITAIEGEFAALRLVTLRLADNELTDISAFTSCTVLRNVDIRGNSISDISILEKSSVTLQMLGLSGNPLDANDLSFISNCAELKELYIDGISLNNLDFLSGCTKLTDLTAIGCGITDISGLSNCTEVSLLRLANNKISDISALANMKSTSYVIFDLSINPLTDVSALPILKYSTLALLCDDLDPATIPADIKGTALAVVYDENLLSSPVAERTFSYVTVYGCPADKRVAMEDKFGTYTLRFADTVEELVIQMEKDKLDYSFLPDLAD